MSDYSDRWITVNDDGIKVRAYYFPIGSKLIPWDSIRSVDRVNMGVLTGRARIWGTANTRYWASLDPGRVRKRTAFLVDNAKPVKPFLTPDDPQAFESVLLEHGKTVEHEGRSVVI